MDVVMPMYNLIEYSNNYSKTFGDLWLYSRDEPDAAIVSSESVKSKKKITGKNTADGKDVKIPVPLKYLSSFRRTLEMSVTNCEINHILTWSAGYIIFSATGTMKFAVTDTKLYVLIVTLLAQDKS